MRKIFFAISLLALFASTALFVTAHPGRTDSNGGHTDRSTGEYHYHHGYSAHGHYDMDGDGDIDCPYEFDDKTNHSSGGGYSSDRDHGPGISYQPATNSKANDKDKGEGQIYCYVSLGFIITFFILVNCLAIHIDRTDTPPSSEPASLPSVFLSVFSTLIVFALLFCIMYIFKQPLTWREISFREMVQILFFSAILGGIVWLVTNWASLFINMLLCNLFNEEVHGWAGSFQRLTIPLSYAFTVLLFILQ